MWFEVMAPSANLPIHRDALGLSDHGAGDQACLQVGDAGFAGSTLLRGGESQAGQGGQAHPASLARSVARTPAGSRCG